jgi:hypothetical protein
VPSEPVRAIFPPDGEATYHSYSSWSVPASQGTTLDGHGAGRDRRRTTSVRAPDFFR